MGVVQVSRHGWCMAETVVLHGVSDDLLRVAIAADLARYKGLSRAHTSSELQVFLRWCTDHQLDPLTVRRPDVELFVRWLEGVRRFQTVHGGATAIGGDLLLPHLRDRRRPGRLPGRLCSSSAGLERVTDAGLSHLQFQAMIVAAHTSTNLFDFTQP
jgi:integrase/recombinase XerD